MNRILFSSVLVMSLYYNCRIDGLGGGAMGMIVDDNVVNDTIIANVTEIDDTLAKNVTLLTTNGSVVSTNLNVTSSSISISTEPISKLTISSSSTTTTPPLLPIVRNETTTGIQAAVPFTTTTQQKNDSIESLSSSISNTTTTAATTMNLEQETTSTLNTSTVVSDDGSTHDVASSSNDTKLYNIIFKNISALIEELKANHISVQDLIVNVTKTLEKWPEYNNLGVGTNQTTTTATVETPGQTAIRLMSHYTEEIIYGLVISILSTILAFIGCKRIVVYRPQRIIPV